VWDGNEVWLLAGGGTLFFAFPAVYASSFSGFYLPLMIVLWLLILRGISIEFRNHLDSPTWKPLWDFTFTGASALLAIFFGAALGNVVRGVPLDASGDFFLPLWTDFLPGADAGILDWYTILVGLFALAALTLHGSLWVWYKTEGAVQARCRQAAWWSYFAVLACTVATTLATWSIQPQVPANFARYPLGSVFPLLAIGGLAGIPFYLRRGRELMAFLHSCLFLAGMLTSAAFGLFPYVLPSNAHQHPGLTVFNAAAPAYGLRVGLVWWTPGMLLAGAYSVYVYSRFRGKVRVED
ncbi:MAG: cytochrome d ubiquinol oxidase subunit II, partial [Acidobacteria bacterium]|nr:cytochrome d ubiquinol oxidase subunit II [Acidobacteriota bacterium]